MSYTWKYQLPSKEETDTALELANEVGINPLLGSILLKRGIKTKKEAKKFFHPQLIDLYDPFLMKDMYKAVERLNKAIGMKEKILVYGDYDVDGCTAVTLVYKFLHKFYSNVSYYIPDRYDDGYGVSIRAIDRAVTMGVKVIIILDCGIKANEEIAYAKERGIDFIICDHHVPDAQLPPAYAILDPKRKDETYPENILSGCGLGFKLMQAFAEDNGIEFSSLMPLLELCAVSIAADMVPIIGENRILAYNGLRHLNANPSVGMQAILTICGLTEKEITINDIIFRIGPRINASGRIQNGSETIDLLIETDLTRAIEKANIINTYNDARRDIDKQVTEEANSIVDSMTNLEDRHSIVVYNDSWHKGVIGIVASRLTELYYRPTVVMAVDNGKVTGSARSAGGFDIYSAIESCSDLLENFGGHTLAVGLSLKVENIAEFMIRFEEYVEEHIKEEQTVETINIDTQLNFNDIDFELYQDIKRLAPFGPGNPEPIFCTYNVYDYGTSKVVGHSQEHIRLELVDNHSNKVINGIAFGQSSHARYIKTKRAFNICYTIQENTYKHNEIQLQIEDIKPAVPLEE
ncbi:MAG: single-stranded-DNA-specific exonuclease RecJ [Prevotellaceae bacterium]|nr:single-stranded-DNA-specific exonuclease RecJ [Candidatus Faecinaster equi]